MFKLYNTRKQKSNLLLYLFIMLSVLIAVSISLAIPQIISETDRYMTGQVEELNGGDLKVEATYASSAYDRKLDELKTEGLQISKQSAFSTTFKYGDGEIFGSLIIGEFGLQDNEIILFAPLADELNIKQNDTLSIGNQTYTVKDIESTPRAVDGQSEMIGYGKVSFYPITNEMPNNFVTIINGDRINTVKSELKTIEPGYTYSTIEDKKQAIQAELNTHATTLNILNTMSYIMTILSVLSGIFMIIVQRQQDIAIMRLLSIRMKSIKKALRMELYLVFVVPVLLGSIASIPLARQLLVRSGVHNVGYDSSLIGRVFAGFLLFLLIYYIFINIATKALEAIQPLFVIRGDSVSFKTSKRKVTWLSVLFALLTLVLYTVYLGRGSALLSSIVIVVCIGFFFILTLWCIKLLSSLPLKNKLFHYTAKNIKANRYAFVITVLSLTLTSLFLLVGYTLEKTVRDSYTAGVEQKINYNYLIVSDDPAKLENALIESEEVEGYTKLYRHTGTLLTTQGSSKSAQICSINEGDYQIKYKVLKGEDVFQGSADDVLISSTFSEQMQVNVGGTLKMELNGIIKDYRVKGIYEAGQVNPAFILKPAVNESNGSLLFLVKADSNSFKENLSGVSLMHISIMGMAIMKRMADFLTIFKWLCWICIFSSVLFNLNLIYMNYLNEYKESVIIRALGIGKGFLYKYLGLKSVYAILLSLLMSLGLYMVVLSLALEVIFKVNITITAETIVIPVSCALGIVGIIFFIPFRLLQRSHGFEELREQV